MVQRGWYSEDDEYSARERIKDFVRARCGGTKRGFFPLFREDSDLLGALGAYIAGHMLNVATMHCDSDGWTLYDPRKTGVAIRVTKGAVRKSVSRMIELGMLKVREKSGGMLWYKFDHEQWRCLTNGRS